MVLRPVPGARRLADAATTPTSAGMLAAGEEPLSALVDRLPRRAALAARAGLPPPPASGAELLARVARHRGVDFAALDASAARLRAAADGVRRRHVALAEEAGALWESWAGDEADDVADGVSDVARAAHGVVTTLEELAARLEDAAVAVADAVATLAATLAELPPADGLTPRGAPDVAGIRAWAAPLDAQTHRLLAVLDRTDAAVDGAWAGLATGVAELTARVDADDPDLGSVEALLGELVGPVGLPAVPETELRPPR